MGGGAPGDGDRRRPTFAIDETGSLTADRWPVRRVASPNRDARPPGTAITLLVVHGISLPPGEFGGPWIDALFTNRLDPDAHPYFRGIATLRVSAHFIVRRDGEVVQYVSCADRAWHAGVSSFDGRERCNDFSIGIELEGDDETPYEAAQYRVLAALTHALVARYPVDAVAGHADVAPGRKTDPGPAFDWARYLADAPTGLRHPRTGRDGRSG